AGSEVFLIPAVIDVSEILDPSVVGPYNGQVLHFGRLEALAIVEEDRGVEQVARVNRVRGKREVEFSVLVEVGDQNLGGRINRKGGAVPGRITLGGAPIDV